MHLTAAAPTAREELFLIGPELTAILLYGSVLFCWLCVELVSMGAAPPEISINKPERQLKVCVAACAVVVAMSGGLSAAYAFFPARMPLASEQTLNLIVGIAMLALALVGTAFAGDSPASSGLSLKNAQTILFFLVPPAALILFPGGAVNMKLVAGSITVATAAPAIAEEIFFRGYLQARFQKTSGPMKGILFAALAATIYRAVPLCFTAGLPTVALVSVIYFIVWGVIAGRIRYRTGNVFGIMILHIFWDVAARVLAGVSIQ